MDIRKLTLAGKVSILYASTENEISVICAQVNAI